LESDLAIGFLSCSTLVTEDKLPMDLFCCIRSRKDDPELDNELELELVDPYALPVLLLR